MGPPLKRLSPFRACIAAATLALALLSPARAHDIWLEAGAPILRPGDAVKVDLLLGNHGNNHRDFKQAGKADPKKVRCEVIAPDGKASGFSDKMIDTGFGPKEGYWTARVGGDAPGLHLLVASSDQVVAYAPTRSIKCAKTFFLVSKSLDRPPMEEKGFDRIVGAPLELVPRSNPVAPMGPGTPIKVRLLYKGKPMAGAVVSFIPRGTALAEGFDETYERKTDAGGDASFEPKSANDYLVAAHHEEPKEGGEGFENTKYSATLTVKVSAIGACRGE